MNAIYTAVLSRSGDKFRARVPDLPGCISSGSTLAEALEEITDAMNVWLCAQEDVGQPIPEPTPQKDIPMESDEICSLVQCDTIRYRAETETKAVRKNVSLPAWMAVLAEKKGLNCSKVLQEALLKKLEAAQ